MSETGGIERPRRKKRKKGKSKLSTEQRAVSYVIGGGLFLLGVGLLVWFSRLDRAPGKIFNLLAAGGVGSLLSGLGLFLHPLTRSGWTPFRTIPIRSRCSASCPGSGSSGCWSSSPRWGGLRLRRAEYGASRRLMREIAGPDDGVATWRVLGWGRTEGLRRAALQPGRRR